jgi:hypothetical protein
MTFVQRCLVGDLALELRERLEAMSHAVQAADSYGRRSRSIMLKRQLSAWLQAQTKGGGTHDALDVPPRETRGCNALDRGGLGHGPRGLYLRLTSTGAAHRGVRPGLFKDVIQEWD